MIRVLAAIAALAAIPSLAAAQGAIDNANVTVLGQRPDSYSMILNVSGLNRTQASGAIWNAAYIVCRRAPYTGNLTDNKLDAMSTCVTEARYNAMVQYNRIRGW